MFIAPIIFKICIISYAKEIYDFSILGDVPSICNFDRRLVPVNLIKTNDCDTNEIMSTRNPTQGYRSVVIKFPLKVRIPEFLTGATNIYKNFWKVGWCY